MSLTLLFLLLTTPYDQFQRANAHYEAGRFDQALLLYDSLLNQIPSAETYYNRGNTQFKLGKLGYALADYLRAYALNPKDPDIKNNIQFIRQFRPDKTTEPESPLLKIGRNALTLLNPHLTRLLSAVAFFLFCAALALWLITTRRYLLFTGIGIAVLFLYFGIATIVWGNIVNPAKAVIVAAEAILRSGPGAEYKEIAAVHDGTEVKILERRPEFLLIQLPGGLGGWVEKEAIEPVFR